MPGHLFEGNPVDEGTTGRQGSEGCQKGRLLVLCLHPWVLSCAPWHGLELGGVWVRNRMLLPTSGERAYSIH